MEYTKLGNTGLDVSKICLGAMSFGDPVNWIHKWVLEEADSRPIIKGALDLGINFFDTANVYSIGRSEEILGAALKDYAKRDEIVLATKVHQKMFDGPNGGGLSRKHIMSQIDQSLKRLQTDYVDLYIIHRWDTTHRSKKRWQPYMMWSNQEKLAILAHQRCMLTNFKKPIILLRKMVGPNSFLCRII